MQNVSDLVQPLIGQIAWGVGRGHGSFLRMEFGAPHLVVREPVVPRQAVSAKAQRILLRRQVHLQGDWTFWVNYADWELRTRDGVVDSANDHGSPADERLRELEGQKLTSIEAGTKANSCVLRFDLGAVLAIWPSAEMQEDQWSLHAWQGPVASFGADGRISLENAANR
jgi:hypothetical protein